MSVFEQALAAHRAGDLAAAERGYRAILAAGHDDDALGNLGLAVWRRGDTVEGGHLLREAAEKAPGRRGAHLNLGNFYWRMGRLDEAEHAYLAALAISPDWQDARLNLGNVYLTQGRLAEGWPLYDERRERHASEAHKLGFPEWRGEPLQGKRLFIFTEQGFGDQIFAARYIPLLQAAEVTMASRPALARLFAQLPVNVVPRSPEGVRVEAHDYWTLPLSLPRWVGGAPAAPYLRAPTRGEGGIGVVWRGNALPDPHRSVPDHLASELLSLPGARSLHPEDTGAQDFQDTAEIIAGLDLVISIDTSVAHLAGALGKPTWVMLQRPFVDWRWIEGISGHSLWYPTTKLIHQEAAGDWRSVMAKVAGLLRAEA